MIETIFRIFSIVVMTHFSIRFICDSHKLIQMKFGDDYDEEDEEDAESE